MHPEERAFRDQIIRNPDCDTVRLAFSDWLEENGQGGLASYVRHMIELHRSGNIVNQWSEGDWSQLHKMPCPVCEQRPAFTEVYCKVCRGIGDLFQRNRYVSQDGRNNVIHVSRNPVFSRGFVESIECSMEELGEECMFLGVPYEPAERKFVPSEWVKAVMRDHPIRKLVILGRSPLSFDGRHLWHNGDHVLAGGSRGEPNELPSCLHQELNQHSRGPVGITQRVKSYPDRKIALDDLYTVVTRLVRKSIINNSPQNT